MTRPGSLSIISQLLSDAEPLVVLSHIAAKYPDFGLGTAVIVTPWHHPLRIAEEIAMLTLLSDGPLRIGLGSRHGAA